MTHTASRRSSSLHPPCTPTAPSTASSGEVTEATPQNRSQPPTFGSWYGKDLKRYAAGLTVKGRRGLVFEPRRVDRLHPVSNASVTSPINALTKRDAYHNSNGLSDVWEGNPIVTPEKKARPKWKGKGKTTKIRQPIKSSTMLCRMLYLLTCEKLFLLWINSQQPVTRDEQDGKAMGKNHLFYVELAKAFVDKDWKTTADNSISVPSTHRFDSTPAPQDFIDLLAGFDLETTATVMRQALGRNGGGNVLFQPLQVSRSNPASRSIKSCDGNVLFQPLQVSRSNPARRSIKSCGAGGLSNRCVGGTEIELPAAVSQSLSTKAFASCT